MSDSVATGHEDLVRVLDEEGDRLYALAMRVTRDPGLAADAVQEAFVSALQHRHEFRGESRLGTWLHRIVFTKSIDLLRRRGRELPLPEEDSAAGEALIRAAGWAHPPDEMLLGVEARQALERALGELTPIQRAVFELREVEGRSSEEAAEILGIPATTARVYLHRARMRLRALLGPLFRRGAA